MHEEGEDEMRNCLGGAVLRATLVFLLSVATGLPALAGTASPYLIQPGDVLDISVWKEPDLQRQRVLVRPDGAISFPLVGDLEARGHSVPQLAQMLTQKLSAYLPDPVVTVTIREMSGNRIYVLGQVNRPGDFVVTRPISVLQALAMAGGLTAYADEKGIRVLRGNGPDQVSVPFNYKEVEQGERLEQNIVLQPGDIVMVP